MKKLFRIFLFIIVLPVTAVVIVQVAFYLSAPIYDFSEPQAFTGSRLYNPYKNMDKEFWRKYNFQVQSKAWGGVTDGRKNTNVLIDSVYRELGFDYVATSDYMKINYHGQDKSTFIPTYEHGYNLFKTHQVAVDAKKVLWIDYIFSQTKSMKQWIIDLLDKNSQLVVLAHPLLRNGYTLDDMKYLTNYEYMEVLNNLRISTDHWDTALSSGQLVWIMGNDDAHDVLSPNDVGRKFTMINSPSLTRHSIIENLRQGNAYGVDFYPKMDVPLTERVELSKHIPSVREVSLNKNILTVAVSRIADEIQFIGQNGKLLASDQNTSSATYPIQDDDSYVRTVIKFADQTTIYLNPILRYEGDEPRSLKSAVVNKPATTALRLLYIVIAMALLFFFFKHRTKKARKK